MADEKKDVAPVAPEKTATTAAKVLQYVGPKPAPSIGNLPGLAAYATVKVDALTPEQITFVQQTVPEAATWWK